MRADMAKVIVERPRRPGYTSKGHPRVRDMEDLPRHEGMTRPHRMNWGGKELNENLAPLRRFLLSRVGHKWDAVYSEICENLKATSAVQQHVRDHVRDFVITNVTVDEQGELWGTNLGVPYLIGGDGYWRHREMYVDPRDGVLKITPQRARVQSWQARREAEWADTHKWLDAEHQLRKHEGIWYWCEVKPMQRGKWVSYVDPVTGLPRNRYVAETYWDVLLQKFVAAGDSDTWRNTYVVSKRQLSHKELKHHGVQND